MGWQWRQTSPQTDNHSSTSSLNFYRPDALPDDHPSNSVKVLKAHVCLLAPTALLLLLLAATLRGSRPGVQSTSLYDNFGKPGNYVTYDVIIWVQDGNCKKMARENFSIGAFYNITKNSTIRSKL